MVCRQHFSPAFRKSISLDFVSKHQILQVIPRAEVHVVGVCWFIYSSSESIKQTLSFIGQALIEFYGSARILLFLLLITSSSLEPNQLLIMISSVLILTECFV